MAITGGLAIGTGGGPASSLLIGIGNPLRGDDGAAPWLVRTWAQRRARRRAWPATSRPVVRAGPHDRAGVDRPERVIRLQPAMGDELPAGLRVRVVDQLLPELAVELAAVRRVLFIDAWLGSPRSGPEDSTPRLRAITPARRTAGGWGPTDWTPAHHLTPSDLLQLSAVLCGRTPAAQSLLIPAMEFAATHPEGGLTCFSSALRGQLPLAWQLLDQWLMQEVAPPCPPMPRHNQD